MKTKKAFIMILMSALGVLNAHSQLPSYVPTNGLVGYWPFNGNANDESGNGNNGTVNGATLTADRNGVANKAYSFDGSNNYIAMPTMNNIPMGNSARTLSVWMNPSRLWNQWTLTAIGYGSPSTKNAFMFGLGNNIIAVQGWASDYSSPLIYTVGQWLHAVCTYDGTNIKIYVDGVLIGSGTNTLWNTNGTEFYFGARPSQGNSFFPGQLDDIGIWNRVLTQQEITALYNSQTCTNPTATINPQSTTSFCQGGSVNLNASTGTNYTYQWYNNGNIINNATSSVYNATTSGNYTVKVTDGTCNATSSTQAVTVNTNPSVSLNGLNNIVFKTSLPIQLVGNPSGGTYSGDAVSGSIFTPTNASLGKKIISYNYTTQQGCSGSTSQTTIVTDSVGNVCSTYDTLKIKVKFTAGLYANTTNTIKFYPNPTKDVLFIDNGNYQAMSGYSIKIVSLTGTVVYNQPITSQQVQISMNQFATKGLYIAQIIDSNNAIVDSKKIVLE